jgi:hypothetical protein
MPNWARAGGGQPKSDKPRHGLQRAVAIVDEQMRDEVDKGAEIRAKTGPCFCPCAVQRLIRAHPFLSGDFSIPRHQNIPRPTLMPYIAQDFGKLGIGLGGELFRQSIAAFQPLQAASCCRRRTATDPIIGEPVKDDALAFGPRLEIIA